MLTLNSVRTMVDIKKIRQIYDQVETHVRGLQAQGVDSAQYGKLLIPIMMAKIPEDALSSAVNSVATIGI